MSRRLPQRGGELMVGAEIGVDYVLVAVDLDGSTGRQRCTVSQDLNRLGDLEDDIHVVPDEHERRPLRLL